MRTYTSPRPRTVRVTRTCAILLAYIAVHCRHVDKRECQGFTSFTLKIMLAVIAKHIKEVSVLRRLLFCASHLNREVPEYWSLVVQFAMEGMQDAIRADIAAALVKILKKLILILF